ncbi:SLOG family protein [Parafrankia sp. FMc2]|uniref:SLOG family protein n=1 Tax=Parafrankia sp. FMc2 TaxID=3233196 RepID=UPI0034D3B8A4
MRVLITGARVWRDRSRVWADLDRVHALARSRGQRLTVVHGDARGADRLARAWCERTSGVGHEKYPVSPAEWKINGQRAGHLRNAHMVKLGADGAIAYCVPCDKPGPCYGLGGVLLPAGHATHGTWGCMELARDAGITVWERWSR